jgi:alpha-L-fucosidase
LAGKVKYAQILNDASELKLGARKGAWLDDVKKDDDGLKITIPVRKPNVEIPVIELFLN